jgi:hypothetical protein
VVGAEDELIGSTLLHPVGLPILGNGSQVRAEVGLHTEVGAVVGAEADATGAQGSIGVLLGRRNLLWGRLLRRVALLGRVARLTLGRVSLLGRVALLLRGVTGLTLWGVALLGRVSLLLGRVTLLLGRVARLALGRVAGLGRGGVPGRGVTGVTRWGEGRVRGGGCLLRWREDRQALGRVAGLTLGRVAGLTLGRVTLLGRVLATTRGTVATTVSTGGAIAALLTLELVHVHGLLAGSLVGGLLVALFLRDLAEVDGLEADVDLSVALALLEQQPLILDLSALEAGDRQAVAAEEVISGDVVVPDGEDQLAAVLVGNVELEDLVPLGVAGVAGGGGLPVFVLELDLAVGVDLAEGLHIRQVLGTADTDVETGHVCRLCFFLIQ